MKKISVVIIICLVFALLSGCSNNGIYTDDREISKTEDKFSARDSVGNTNGSEYSLLATMTGSRTIWRYDAESDSEVTISYLLSVVQGGKAKLVLITPDDEVVVLVENSDNSENTEIQSQTIQLTQGRNRIKIVGYDDPEFNLKLTADVGQLGQ
jgi:hypothetical protein